MLKRAIEAGLPDFLLFRALWDTALLEKKLGRPAAALRVFTELATCRNEYRVCALEEIAKYYEHEERNYTIALEITNQALEFPALLGADAAAVAAEEAFGEATVPPDVKIPGHPCSRGDIYTL